MKKTHTLLGVFAILLIVATGVGFQMSEGPKPETPTVEVRAVAVERPVPPVGTALTRTQRELAALGLDPDLTRGFGVSVGKKKEVSQTNTNKKGTVQ